MRASLFLACRRAVAARTPLLLLALLSGANALWAQGGAPAASTELPRGELIPRVACAAQPGETYALYLPSDYGPDRAWSLLLAFHPSARGAAFVELYRPAAERYGYVIAGSNTSTSRKIASMWLSRISPPAT